MSLKPITVLIVDDSPSILDLLNYILNSDPQIKVIGRVMNGKKALKFLEKATPNLITMDIDMPVKNGIDTTRAIMQSSPIPIIIVTASYSLSEVEMTYNALEAGALSIMEKPRGIGHPDHKRMADALIRAIKSFSGVKLVKRTTTPEKKDFDISQRRVAAPIPEQKIELIVIGASTGGPPAIHTILRNLPKDLPVPVMIVQHITEGFVNSFKDWLIKSTGHQVHIANPAVIMSPGHFYIAPNNMQMGVRNTGKIELVNSKPINNLCPSVAYLFKSATKAYGEKVLGIFLTGMGKDGAAELKIMKDKGAITVAQDEESSVIYGMPGEAKKIRAAKYILSPQEIAGMIVKLTKSD